MLDYSQIIFDYYPANIKIAKPLGQTNLQQLFDSIKSPREDIKTAFKKIQEATAKNDLVEKDRLKQQSLYSFTPSVVSDGMGRSYDNIISLNPVMIVEFDKIDFAEELKQYLFNKMTCVMAATLSPSGQGCKLFIRIPQISTISEYKALFCGMAFYLDQIENFDVANFNIILPFFLTWDENILVRPAEKTTEWTTKGSKLNAFKPIEEDFEIPDDINEEDYKEAIDKITYLVNRIEDNGHVQILSTSLVAGGLCASSYVGVSEMEELLHELIANNAYLSKGVSGYCRTASQMLIRGLSAPLLLKRHEERMVQEGL